MLRNLYEQYGVEGYYSTFGHEYTNPHESTIHKHLELLLEHIEEPCLDLCCGNGLVSQFLQATGIKHIASKILQQGLTFVTVRSSVALACICVQVH